MRIAYLTQSYPPMVSGAAIVAEGLAKEMAHRGHTVLVIAASEKEIPYTIHEKNLTVLRLASIQNPLRVDQRFLLYPHLKAWQALKRFGPDVIHTHEPLQLGWIGLRYAKKVNIPITLTTHQLPWFVTKYLPDIHGIRLLTEIVLWKYASWLLKGFTRIISPARAITSIVKTKTGIRPATIGYGINLNVYHPHNGSNHEHVLRERLDLPLASPVLLHVGRLDSDKSVDQVVKAAAEVLYKTNAHLLMIGDGHQKPALIELCKLLGIESRVHFPGFISVNDGLPEIYRMASVFITASEIETQGIVLFEAAASGLPITAIDASCISEIVHNNVNGYLIKTGNIDEMSKAIYKILKNPQVAKMMGKESRKLAEAHKIQITFDEHEKLYFQMLKQVQQENITKRSWWRLIKRKIILPNTNLSNR